MKLSNLPLKEIGILALVLIGIVAIKAWMFKSIPNNLHANSVMIVNRAMNHGGTGVIIHSTPSESSILTNDHVCRAIKNGGVVSTNTENYQVTSIVESELSDLCLVQVASDLGIETSIAQKPPSLYERATIAGHPALMPNVLSQGHFSGRRIIQVLIGFKPCTDQERQDPGIGMMCALFGGSPIVRSFESVLVSATIMPGSSGSGVYNSRKELSGLVFAGNTEFGYAWTVPYEQLVYFITKEHLHLKRQDINQEISMFGQEDESKHLKEIFTKCQNVENEQIAHICSLLRKDVTWHN